MILKAIQFLNRFSIELILLVTPGWFGRIMRTLLPRGPHGVVTGQVLSSKEHAAQQSSRLFWNDVCGQGAFYAKYFCLEDPHIIRRMARKVSGYLLRIPYRLFRRPAWAYQDMLHVEKLLYGAARWLIMGGGRA